MRISKVTSNAIIFDNGNEITFNHLQDCCEQNYADFNQIEEMAFNYDFDEDLQFESVKRAGFRFGNRNRNMMFFIPCYSEQNGYYSSDIQIYYNGMEMLDFEANEIIL